MVGGVRREGEERIRTTEVAAVASKVLGEEHARLNDVAEEAPVRISKKKEKDWRDEKGMEKEAYAS